MVDVQIVRFLNLGMPVRTVSVRAPMEIVKEHVLSRVTWAVMKQKGFSRNDFQKTKDYLEQFQTDDIKEAIAASCNCSVEDADALLNEFIAKAASVIDGTTLENDVMVQVIRNNAQLYAQYMESLRTEWEEQNQGSGYTDFELNNVEFHAGLAIESLRRASSELGSATKLIDRTELDSEISGFITELETIEENIETLMESIRTGAIA